MGRPGRTYRMPWVELKQWNEEAIQLWAHSSLQNQERCPSFSSPIMLSALETHPILSIDPAGPTTEDTAVAYNLVPT
jgi:hypothetical protein